MGSELLPSRDELMHRVQGVDGLLRWLTDKVDGEVMDAAGEQLKVIVILQWATITSM